MRFIFAIILCLVGLWFVFGYEDESLERAAGGGSEAVLEPTADDSASQEADGLFPKAEEIADLSVPAMSDPVAVTIHEILKSLIEDDVGEQQRADLEEKLVITLADEKLGDAATLGSAARAVVDRMLKESESARAAGASIGNMTSFQMAATISMANKLSGRLRRVLKASPDGTEHEGSLLSVDFEFDVPKGYAKAGWEIIGGFRYVEGMELPKSVKALNGKKVGLAGYMMALGEFEDIHLFAVVESQWSCCFGTPPDIHQVVEVTLPDDEIGIELVTVPILVLGTLDVGEMIEDGWVVSVYRMNAETIDVLE